MRKPPVTQIKKPRRLTYAEQAVVNDLEDYGKPTEQTKAYKERQAAIQQFKTNFYNPALKNLKSNAWRNTGINSNDEFTIDEAYRNGLITANERREYHQLASERLLEARRSVFNIYGTPKKGNELVSGRNFYPDPSKASDAKAERYKIYKSALAREQGKLPTAIREGMATVSAGAGAIAGLGLGAGRALLNVGRFATGSQTLDDLYESGEASEQKYLKSVADGADTNMFLEGMYGSAAGTETTLLSPFTVGGELGRRSFIGRGFGSMMGMTKDQQDQAYANLGIGDWYAQKVGDPDNLVRQAAFLSGQVLAGSIPGMGPELVTMRLAGTAFAAATRPLVKTMLQSQVARTVGSMTPMAIGAVGQAGVPGQVTKAFGGTQEQAEFANRATEFAGAPIRSTIEAIPSVYDTQAGGQIDANKMAAMRQAEVDPQGISETAAMVGMFGSGAASFYSDAKQLFKVNRLLAKANATQHKGRFLNAGDRLLRERSELMASVGPDAAFGMNNMFTPIAQAYRAATDKSVDETGQPKYQPPTMSDLGRAALLTFTAVRPHGKLGAFMTPALRGKLLAEGSDIKTQAMFMARDWVDSGEWRGQAINRRFQSITGRPEANPDDVKRAVSKAYELIGERARQAVISGEVLPSSAGEIFFQKLVSGRLDDPTTQREFNRIIANMRVKGDNAPLSDDNPLAGQKINTNIYITDPAARNRAVAELAPQFEQILLKAMAEQSETPATKQGSEQSQEPTKTTPVRQSGQQFFGIRIADTPDGVPQYLAFNTHRGPNGHTFRAVELVRGDQDVSDLIMLDQPTVTRKNAFFTGASILQALQSRIDIFNPYYQKNKWTEGGRTRTIAGFNPDGTVLVKSITSDGKVSIDRMGSIDLLKSLSKFNARLYDILGPILKTLNTNAVDETAELLDYTESTDFPDRIPYTSDDGNIRYVNGRKVATSGGPTPVGIYQLPNGTVLIQPMTGEQAQTPTRPVMDTGQIERSPDILNSITIRDAKAAVESRSGYMRMDIHNSGILSRVPVSADALAQIEEVINTEDSLADKAETIRGIVAEDVAISTSGDRRGLRYSDEADDYVNDVIVRAGDLVRGSFTNESDLQAAVVVKSDSNLVTVRLLSDPTGDAYTVPVDQVVVDVQQDFDALSTAADNFVPTEERPLHRPYQRTVLDEEEFNTAMTIQKSGKQRQRLLNTSTEELPTVLIDLLKKGEILPGDLKLGLLSWAASTQNTEAVIDAIVAAFDDAVKPGVAIYNYLTRVANLYSDSSFFDQLYYVDSLNTSIKTGALLSATSIRSKATAQSVARRMNILAYRSQRNLSPDQLYRQAINSLGVEDNKQTRADAISYAKLMRGIASHAAFHIDNIWQMRALSGTNAQTQVFLGRAIAAVSSPDFADQLTRQDFTPAQASALIRFWKSERSYATAIRLVNEMVKNDSSGGETVRELLSSVGLEFLYYASATPKIKNLADQLMDANSYRRYQQEMNAYIANQAIPTIILKSIENDIVNGDFMGWTDETSAHQTNKVSFIQTLAQLGTEIANRVATSPALDENSKTSLLTILSDLRNQINDMDPATLARIGSYTPSPISGNREFSLTSDGTATNLAYIDSQQSLDRAVQVILDQALSETEAKTIIEEGKDDQGRQQADVLAVARRSVYEQLKNNTHAVAFAMALAHFDVKDISSLNRILKVFEDQFDVTGLKRAYDRAVEAKDSDLIQATKMALETARVNAFNKAFKSFDKVLEVAKQIDALYSDLLDDTFTTIVDELGNAYETMRSIYTSENSANEVLISTGDVAASSQAYGNRLIADTSGDSETADTTSTVRSSLDDQRTKDIYLANVAREEQAELAKAQADNESPEFIADIRYKYDTIRKEFMDSQAQKNESNEDGKDDFIKALNAFNTYTSEQLPAFLAIDNGENMADKVALLMTMSGELMTLLTKDNLLSNNFLPAVTHKTTTSIARQYDRTRGINEDLAAMRRASAPIEVIENPVTGEITIAGLTQSVIAGRRPVSPRSTRIDSMNPDAPDNSVVITEQDLMLSRDDADEDLVDFLSSDALVEITELVGTTVNEEAFDGMATSETPTEKIRLYALHARNYSGMQAMLEGLLLKQFDFRTTLDHLSAMGDAENSQRRIARAGAAAPERIGKLSEQNFDNPDIARAAQNNWKVRVADVLKKQLRNIERNERFRLQRVIDSLDVLFNPEMQVADQTVETFVTEASIYLKGQLKNVNLPDDVFTELSAAFSVNGMLRLFSQPDYSGAYYSHRAGYVDTPYEIATAIGALEGDDVSYLHRDVLPTIYSQPADINSITPATAEYLVSLYDKLDMSVYSQADRDEIIKTKRLYEERMTNSSATVDMQVDLGFMRTAKDLSIGLAKLYDNFAFGYAQKQYAMLLTSDRPEHRAEIVDAMRKVGVSPEIVDVFKGSAGSFAAILDALAENMGVIRSDVRRQLLTDEQKNALQTYLIAKYRMNYYMHSGKMLMTSSELMRSTSAQMVTAKDGRQIHGAFLAAQRLMMIASEANGPRTADTLYHEMTHALFTALDDMTQVNFLSSLLPSIEDISDPKLKDNPLFPAILQMRAIEIFNKAYPESVNEPLSTKWRSDEVVQFWQEQGMSEDRIKMMQRDWFGSAHEMFAVALQNFIADFGEPISDNPSRAVDTDAAAIFQQVAAPIRSMWTLLARSSPADMILENGKPHKAWSAPIPTAQYMTGNKRVIEYPAVRQGDYVRLYVPNKGRLDTDAHNIFNVSDLLKMWMSTGQTDSVHHKFGFKVQYTIAGPNGEPINRQVNVPFDNKNALAYIHQLVNAGGDVDFFVIPAGSDTLTDLTESQNWSQPFNGRIVDKVVLRNKGDYQRQTVFAYTIGGKQFDFVSLRDNDGVLPDGFFSTRFAVTDDAADAGPKDPRYTTVPNTDSYFVIEAPVTVAIRDKNKRGSSRRFEGTARYLVSSRDLMDSTYNPQLLGYSGDFNPKFSATLYDLNSKLDTITRSISDYHSYQDQLTLEKKLFTGTANDFRTNTRDMFTPAQRIAAYHADQGKDVRAAGVDMYAPIVAGRNTFEANVLEIMRSRGLMNPEGGYTEEGYAFLERLNTFGVTPLAQFMQREGIFRHALKDSRHGVYNNNVFTIDYGSAEYNALSNFSKSLEDSLRQKALAAGVPFSELDTFIVDGQNEFFNQLYSAMFVRPVNRAAVKEGRRPVEDRVQDVIDAFNEGLPEGQQLSLNYIDGTTAGSVLPIFEYVLNSSQIGGSDAFSGIRIINDLLTALATNQPIELEGRPHHVNGAGYVLNRTMDVIFGRDNFVGKTEFLDRLTSLNENERAKAIRLVTSTASILDLQERVIANARYNWQKYSLPTGAFVDNGKVRIVDDSGRMLQVNLRTNEVVNIAPDYLRSGKVIKADIHSNRYPLYNPEAPVRYASVGDPLDVRVAETILNSLSKMEAEQLAIDPKGIVILRERDYSSTSSDVGIHLYRLSKNTNKDFLETGLRYKVYQVNNPYKGFYHVHGDDGTLTEVNNQRILTQSPAFLMGVAMNQYFDTANPENYESLERIRKTSIIRPEVFIAKMLIARAQRTNPDTVSSAWRKDMSKQFKVNNVTIGSGDQSYSMLQSAIVNNRREGTWMSSGDMPSEHSKPFSELEMSLVRGLGELPVEAVGNEDVKREWQLQRLEDIEKRISVNRQPENIIIQKHNDVDQVGVSVDGDDVYFTIPENQYDDVISAMFSSSPAEIDQLKNLPNGQGATLPTNSLPPDYPVWRAIADVWTEGSGWEVVKRLSRDFARPFIQNYALVSMRPKDMAMQMYGLLGMAPNIWFPHGSNGKGTLFQKLFAHQKDTAYGDIMYHRIIDGIFRKYGRIGSQFSIGAIPFTKKATVPGIYDKELGRSRSYTIEDLNEFGLSTSYGEWYATAAAIKAANPLIELKDVPIQLTGAENLGGGVLGQRLIPFVGMTERGGLLSTDLLRIKQFLELARIVDRKVFESLGRSDSWVTMEQNKLKRNFARIINTISGSPVGDDVLLHPVAREVQYKAQAIFTAPNWGKSLKMFTLLPMVPELTAGYLVNMAFRPVWRKFFKGVGYNTVNLGAYHNFLSAIGQVKTADGNIINTPFSYYLTRFTGTAINTALLFGAALFMQNIAQSRALLAAQGKQTHWYQIAKIKHLMDEQKLGVTQPPAGTAKVVTLGNMEVQAPPIIMGWNRFLLQPYLQMQRNMKAGESLPAAAAEALFSTEFTSRVNPMYVAMKDQLTGKTNIFNSATYQEHPGWRYFLAHSDDLIAQAGPFGYQLALLKLAYPNGMSRAAMNGQMVPIQKMMNDLERMQYVDNADYNHSLANWMRFIGLENEYYNYDLDVKIPNMSKGGIRYGDITRLQKQFEYDYPGIFQTISEFGLGALWSGIPGTGDISGKGFERKQPVPYPLMPTQKLIESSTRRPDRLKKEVIEQEARQTLPAVSWEQLQRASERGSR